MSNEILAIVPRLEAALYDGTNGEWIAEAFYSGHGSFLFVDGATGDLYFNLGSNQCIVPSGRYCLRQNENDATWKGSVTEAQLASSYTVIDPAS